MVNSGNRHRRVLANLAATAEFDVGEVKRTLGDERPGFITRIVNELAGEGWLVREGGGDSLRWNAARGTFAVDAWLAERGEGVQIKAQPEGERPRERLLKFGAEALPTSALLAVLIGRGQPRESAVMAGERVNKAFAERLQDLPLAAAAELKGLSVAVGSVAYCQIMAGIELGRRVSESTCETSAVITSAEDAISFARHRFARLARDARQEEFHIVTLDTRHHVINIHRITVGLLDASLVHPREVFRPAIKDAAATLLLVHNHPSGDATPSAEDYAVTRRIESAGELIGIGVLDHLVVAARGSTLDVKSLRREAL